MSTVKIGNSLSLVTEEILNQKFNGYEPLILGDFNAHIKVSERFQFAAYPHPENNNGHLLVEFAENMGVYCLNGLAWQGVTECKYTYQRDLGIRYNASIVDYILFGLVLH